MHGKDRSCTYSKKFHGPTNMGLQSKTVSLEATSPNLTILSQIRPGQSCVPSTDALVAEPVL